MREIALFVEDSAHRRIVGPLVERLAREQDATVRLDWRSAVRGHPRVMQRLRDYLRDVARQDESGPGLIVVATDANCAGFNERVRRIKPVIERARPPVVLGIPDPHVERWLLLDGAAFKAALGRGCDAPDQKCDRERYKRRLVEAVRDAGVTPSLGGLEYAEDIIGAMDIDRAARADESFARFVGDLRNALGDLRREEPRP